MTQTTPAQPMQRHRMSRFGRMLVSCLFGALAICLVAPLAWFVVVMFLQPSTQAVGVRLSTLVGAAPAVALFAAAVAFPVCVVFGPAVLALAARSAAAPRRLATLAGSFIGAMVLAASPWLSSASGAGQSLGLGALGATLGAVGAWVAARHHFAGLHGEPRAEEA